MVNINPADNTGATKDSVIKNFRQQMDTTKEYLNSIYASGGEGNNPAKIDTQLEAFSLKDYLNSLKYFYNKIKEKVTPAEAQELQNLIQEQEGVLENYTNEKKLRTTEKNLQEKQQREIDNYRQERLKAFNPHLNSSKNTFDEYSNALVVQKNIPALKTGGIYAEYDEKTGITTTYNKNTNTIILTDKNGEVLSKTNFDDNPIQQKQEENLNNDNIHMSDYISGVSDDTKSYLKDDKVFTDFSNKFVQLEVLKSTSQDKLADAKNKLEKAKINYNNTPFTDPDKKNAAKEKYIEAKEVVQYLQNEIWSAEQEQNKLLKNKMLPYAYTIENWQNGDKIEITFQGAKVGTRIYTKVTLDNGEKAYEYGGDYYPLAPNGLPQPEYIEELHNH